MNQSISAAATSMASVQQKIDMIADNIANVNTIGYKRKQGVFEDLLTSFHQQPASEDLPGRVSSLGLALGHGSRMIMIEPDLTQGNFQETNGTYDLAIDGNALFEVTSNQGGVRAFTRDGAFQLSLRATGEQVLSTQQGFSVVGMDGNPIVIPANAKNVQIDSLGRVNVESSNGQTIEVGQLHLVKPTRPTLLTAVADNLYMVTEGANVDDVVSELSTEDKVAVRQGFLEQSNSDLTTEMTEVTTMQRTYQMLARAISSGDTLAGLANNMRG